LADPVVAAAGDIACGADTPAGTPCKQRQTSDLVAALGPSAVLPLGDLQYERGQLANFLDFYNPSWGRLKAITKPAVGNHEYMTPEAAGYFDYFNGIDSFTGPGGRRDQGYYSFDLGSWHLIALNTSIDCEVVPCNKGSAQEQWLRADLRAHPTTCTLAYMHQPRWSSDGVSTNDTPKAQPLLDALYDGGADLLLAGHAHFYERFAPQDPSQRLDPARGIRHFIVGTGGKSLLPLGAAKPNSEVRNASTFGVLTITLHPSSYDWRFVPLAGGSFTDSGTGRCHGPVALWRMDETSGSVMRDSARTHNGTLHSVQLRQPGFSRFAYGFTGSSYVTVPSADDLNPGSANIVINIHLNTTKVPASPDWDLIRKGYYATRGGEFKVEYQPSGQASCGFKGSSRYAELIAGPRLNDGRWHAIRCVKTETAIKLIVDGQTFSKTVTIGSISNTEPIVIGAHPGADFFKGLLDEARIRIE
jgi:hypothetical protein